ncbi:MAG: hypothetical protein BroJett018_11340 [Chloroflexota bacterium]|nr:hypothetical protein [Chloroflexota bacterium]NOG64865.1 AAA family ATPase [Chloroflexota bacterium]GIK63340.1 MAG: hypothetical protein BroJett018_11340 [Chloroflexota bacterium]
MVYIIQQRDNYKYDIFKLPKKIQLLSVEMDKELRFFPTRVHGSTIKKLQGYKLLWRYRIDDYRFIYAVNGNIVEMLMAGNRKDVYERLSYDPENVDEELAMAHEAALFPESEIAQELKRNKDWHEYILAKQEIADNKRKQEEFQQDILPYSLDTEILEKWRIQSEYHEILCQCRTQTELLDAKVPYSVVSRVIDLLYPKDIKTISEKPIEILSSGYDLIKFSEGEISRFLLKLDQKQESLVDWALEGPTMVKGGPGTGKSTVAMYRVKTLIERAYQKGIPVPNILFTTYTNALVNISNELLSQLLMGYSAKWEVKTIDKVAHELAERRIQKRIIDDNYWFGAIGKTLVKYEPKLASLKEILSQKHRGKSNNNNLLLDYLVEECKTIIDGRGINNLDEYLESDRTGRGIALQERQRIVIWQLYQDAMNWLNMKNYTPDVKLKSAMSRP